MSADIKPLAKGDKARVAIYVAHPDDESGYAAGTLKKLAEKDHAVEAVMLTHGEGGRIVAKQGGEIVEQRAPKDFTVPYLVKTRDTEVKVAADWIGLQLQETLYPAAAGFDFDFTHDTAETLQRWDQLHPGGLAAMVTDLVDDIRRRQPDVVLVLGEEDLGGVKEHGHHKASAILVDLAARLAADPRVGSQPVHVVRELLSSAPRGKSDVHIDVEDNVMRNALLNYPSQFFPEMLPEVLGITKKEHGGRPSQECWSMRWQAKPANGQLGPSHSVLKTLLE